MENIILAFITAVSVFASDPNIESFKSVGVCSDSSDTRCFYCPQAKKFIPLPTSSLDTTPKDSDYEFIDKSKASGGASEEGSR